MKTKLFAIEYRLTLKDDSYMQTTSYVAAKDRDTALAKLSIWRGNLEPEFKKLEYLINYIDSHTIY